MSISNAEISDRLDGVEADILTLQQDSARLAKMLDDLAHILETQTQSSDEGQKKLRDIGYHAAQIHAMYVTMGIVSQTGAPVATQKPQE